MKPLLNQYKKHLIALVLILALLPFSPSLLHWLSDGSPGGGQNQGSEQITLLVPQPTRKPLTITHYCRDTKPLYTLGHEADVAVANTIDSFVNYDTAGMLFYASFIASRSYEDNILSFAIPPVAKQLQPPPPPVYGSDPFQNKLVKDRYEKARAAFQISSAMQQKSLAALRGTVHQETNRLRATRDIFDDTGSDPLGCIALAAQHFQGNPTANKELLIASTMITTTSLQSIGHFSLKGVSVKLIFRTCLLSSAAKCQADNAYWTHFFISAGAKEVQILDPAQSHVSF